MRLTPGGTQRPSKKGLPGPILTGSLESESAVLGRDQGAPCAPCFGCGRELADAILCVYIYSPHAGNRAAQVMSFTSHITPEGHSNRR